MEETEVFAIDARWLKCFKTLTAEVAAQFGAPECCQLWMDNSRHREIVEFTSRLLNDIEAVMRKERVGTQ